MFIATNGGAHPPDKLAKMAAEQIGALILIDEHSGSDDAVRARKEKPRLILDIADAIEAHHQDVQIEERSRLRTHGTVRLAHPVDPRQTKAHANTLEEAVITVQNCARGTMFESAFRSDAVKTAIRSVIGAWFATAIDIERDWVAMGHIIGPDHRAEPNPDHDPHCPHVRAWLARRAG